MHSFAESNILGFERPKTTIIFFSFIRLFYVSRIPIVDLILVGFFFFFKM